MSGSSTRSLVMGTRGSPLALAQARQFARQLEAAHTNLVVEERIIRTTGDKNQTSSLPSIGGKGVFTLEIEAALLDGTIDFAVHSLKDLPPDLPDGLTLGCIPKRESADDVCIVREERVQSPESFFYDIPMSIVHTTFLHPKARVGTSSLRRRAALLNVRPDLEIEDIRGNIDTRLRKMHEQNFDAIVLAEAGLRRLGFTDEGHLQTSWGKCYLFSLSKGWNCVPAPGQGALAIECRQDDNRVLDLLHALEDKATRAEVSVERAVVRALSAGCSTPLGVHARFSSQPKSMLSVMSSVISPDGKERVDVNHEVRFANNAERIGQNVARELIEKGAQQLLDTNH